MIALGPREMAKATAVAALIWSALHFAERVIAGFARCPLEGCLPW
ncbi:hypothetical protein OVA07_14150 [Novosphingobium sp. SL115]|nr:hypothetical protein [Novosphingobium sp. SL115]MCY1672146.1 hypothetical protein [Novosphingobium sp. SL115]